MKKKILWLAPEKNPGGVQSYSQILHSALREATPSSFEILPLLVEDMCDRERVDEVVKEISRVRPDLLHIQHEYGCFGRKIPFFYTFPGFLSDLKKALPQTKCISTAHGVMPTDAVYPWRGRGWQSVPRLAANVLFIRMLRKLWNEGTWGKLDGVIVHSKLQAEVVRVSGCKTVSMIPHFVPKSPYVPLDGVNSEEPTILVFGYFTPEKGQDIVISALHKLRELAGGKKFRVILAGGVRREEDLPYFDRCRREIHRGGFTATVEVTGFVREEDIDPLYARTDLVVTPFRSTTGSGSLVYALARGAPILASDLSLNLEINERERDCLAFFRSEDAEDLAKQAWSLLSDPEKLRMHRERSRKYAESQGLPATAEAHFRFYDRVLSGHP